MGGVIHMWGRVYFSLSGVGVGGRVINMWGRIIKVRILFGLCGFLLWFFSWWEWG